MNSWLQTTFAALATRNFRILWLGTIFSFVAFFMSTVVQSVVAFKLVGTNGAVAWVVFGQGVAIATLGPIGGAFADRWPKRRVIVTGQIAAASVFAAIAALIASDLIHVAFLAAGSFLMGATFAFLGPARQAFVVEVVPEDLRGNAMAINNIANTGSRVFGPAIAGLLLGWPLAGATGAYVSMAVLYSAAAVSTGWLPHSPGRAGAGDKHVFTDVADGFSYVWSHSSLRLLLIFFIATIMVGFPHVTVLPGLLENEFGRDASDVSSLYLASAVGALAASVGVARFADSRRALAIYGGLAFVFGASLVGLALAPSFGAAAVAMFTIGAGSGGFQSLNAAVIARETEPHYIGRVMSLTMLAFAGFGLMALPAGLLADALGERTTLLIMGGCVVGIAAVMTLALMRIDPHASAPPKPAAPHS